MMTTFQPLLKPIAQGRTSEIYNWDKDHILKLYHNWCPPHWIEHEAKVARAIFEAGIPTPMVGEIIESDGRRGIVYERVDGISMLQDMNQRPWLIFRQARILAELQAQFHKISVPGLPSYQDRLERSILQAPQLSEPIRKALVAMLAALPKDQTLCHGDFHPGNIIISPRGPVVIDWMTACSGSPWADVARTSMILTVGVKAAGKQVSPLIRLFTHFFNQTYLTHYQSITKSGKPEFKRWLTVSAAARLDEHIEPEREALLQMVAQFLSSVQ